MSIYLGRTFVANLLFAEFTFLTATEEPESALHAQEANLENNEKLFRYYFDQKGTDSTDKFMSSISSRTLTAA